MRRRFYDSATYPKEILSYIHSDLTSWDHDAVGNPISLNYANGETLISTSLPNGIDTNYPYKTFRRYSGFKGTEYPICRIPLSINIHSIIEEYGAIEFLYRYVVLSDMIVSYPMSSIYLSDTDERIQGLLGGNFINVEVRRNDVNKAWNRMTTGSDLLYSGIATIINTPNYVVNNFRIRISKSSDNSSVYEYRVWHNGILYINTTLNIRNISTLIPSFINHYYITDGTNRTYWADSAVVAGNTFKETEGNYNNYYERYDKKGI